MKARLVETGVAVYRSVDGVVVHPQVQYGCDDEPSVHLGESGDVT